MRRNSFQSHSDFILNFHYAIHKQTFSNLLVCKFSARWSYSEKPNPLKTHFFTHFLITNCKYQINEEDFNQKSKINYVYN